MTMTTKTKGGRRGQDVEHKRPYQQPLLKCFGSVKVLTASGTGAVNEADATPGGNCGNIHQDDKSCP